MSGEDVRTELINLRQSTADAEVKRIARRAIDYIDDLRTQLKEVNTLATVIVRATKE
jgi:hypothetical protein